MVVAVGTTSCSSSSRFGPISLFNEVNPVTLPPGRLRLATRPNATGSLASWKTIGIVVVAAFGATAAGRPLAAITVTWRRMRAGEKLQRSADHSQDTLMAQRGCWYVSRKRDLWNSTRLPPQ